MHKICGKYGHFLRLALLLALAAILSGCPKSAQRSYAQPFGYASYRDIPGVTPFGEPPKD